MLDWLWRRRTMALVEGDYASGRILVLEDQALAGVARKRFPKAGVFCVSGLYVSALATNKYDLVLAMQPNMRNPREWARDVAAVTHPGSELVMFSRRYPENGLLRALHQIHWYVRYRGQQRQAVIRSFTLRDVWVRDVIDWLRVYGFTELRQERQAAGLASAVRGRAGSYVRVNLGAGFREG